MGNGGLGDCIGIIASGSICEFVCNTGYTVLGDSFCVNGDFIRTATCEANPCDENEAPLNGGLGNCSGILQSGSGCQPVCDTGYTVSGETLCFAGELTAASCDAMPCVDGLAPVNGTAGDCGDSLASGSTCQPTCDNGFTMWGSSSCLTGVLTTHLCEVDGCRNWCAEDENGAHDTIKCSDEECASCEFCVNPGPQWTYVYSSSSHAEGSFFTCLLFIVATMILV